MRLRWLGIVTVGLFACSRAPAPPTPSNAGADAAPAPATSGVDRASAPATVYPGPALPQGATRCGSTPTAAGRSLACTRFASTEAAFQWVLAHDLQMLAIGEAHAPKGSESIASTTKRFTDTLLPLVAPRASDVIVELWAPDPKCQKEVKAVASAQKPVTSAQASTNQNEYLVLGNKSKELGVTPWLLRPTCDDFSMLADAGDDAIGKMLGLVKRLTEEKLVQLWERQKTATPRDERPKMVLAYGGAMHNDLFPAAETKDWSFGPDLAAKTANRYAELDLIVPEYIQDTPTWQKMPWYAPYKAEAHTSEAILYQQSERSFTIVLPRAR